VRRLPAAAGVLAVCGGLAVVLTGAAGPFSLNDVFVTLVGLLALVQGLRYANDRRRTEFHAAVTDDPERRWHAPVPGTEFDEVLAGISGFPRPNVRDRVRDRIREAAVETVAAREGVPEPRAAAMLESGAWTDDPAAAVFLGAEEDVPLRVFLRALVSGESRFTYGARRTVAVLGEMEGEA
jgi:hypothetical protein